MIVIRLAVDQDEIGFDVTISVIGPLAGKRVIESAARQWGISGKLIHNVHQDGIKRFGVPP